MNQNKHFLKKNNHPLNSIDNQELHNWSVLSKPTKLLLLSGTNNNWSSEKDQPSHIHFVWKDRQIVLEPLQYFAKVGQNVSPIQELPKMNSRGTEDRC